jgi:hypothetical protein
MKEIGYGVLKEFDKELRPILKKYLDNNDLKMAMYYLLVLVNFSDVDSIKNTNTNAQVEGLIEEWEQYIEQDNCGGTAKDALQGCLEDLKGLDKER